MNIEDESLYEKKYIDVGGIKTCYIEAGEGDPLVLIHGGGAGANGYGNWFACLPLFAKNFRTIAVDMVGFGLTDSPDPDTFEYSQKARYEHIASFIKKMGLKKVSLVGNSMGGATAMGVAVDYPDLCEKLVLMGSAGLNTEIDIDALKPVLGYDYTKQGMVTLIKVLTNDSFQITPEMIHYRHTNSVDPKNEASYGATMAWVKKAGGLYYEEDYIASVKQKTLVVNGKDDQVVPLSSAHKFLDLIDNSWGYIMPHCGHWAMIEYPEDFSSAVSTFIQAH